MKKKSVLFGLVLGVVLSSMVVGLFGAEVLPILQRKYLLKQYVYNGPNCHLPSALERVYINYPTTETRRCYYVNATKNYAYFSCNNNIGPALLSYCPTRDCRTNCRPAATKPPSFCVRGGLIPNDVVNTNSISVKAICVSGGSSLPVISSPSFFVYSTATCANSRNLTSFGAQYSNSLCIQRGGSYLKRYCTVGGTAVATATCNKAGCTGVCKVSNTVSAGCGVIASEPTRYYGCGGPAL